MKQQLLNISGLRQRLQRNYLGIEITDFCIKLVEIEPQLVGLPIVKNCIIEPLADGTISNGIIADSGSIVRSLKHLLSNHKLKSRLVHFVIPTQLVLIRFLKLPDIAEQDLRKMIQFEIEHNLQLPFENPRHDFVKLNGDLKKSKRSDILQKEVSLNKLFKQKKSTGRSPVSVLPSEGSENSHQAAMCDVMLAAAPSERIIEFVEVLEAAGLQLLSFEIKPLSLYRLMTVAYPASKEQSILIADIGKNYMELVILHRGVLKISRNIPLRFPTNQGLFYKDEDNSIDDLCAELADEMDRLIKFYLYTLDHRDHQVTNVYLCGDINGLYDISEYLNNQMPQEVSIMMNPDFESQYLDFDSEYPTFAVPLGLALRGKEA
ncbi:pilus assembly protein PilM [Paenibacillus oenotherae]|uniref:Pilus assembly protein PilM n=1 Tax=Paenibacillus oenotherae TaxID=1435645 RepID=A0ABS7D1L9_9BACL|nr:pilus assembly protein PilM [Paenibacillus oenotherae]MBW7473840.1 pilus assembly protein PilM [Paenibacillus oenotherae]